MRACGTCERLVSREDKRSCIWHDCPFKTRLAETHDAAGAGTGVGGASGGHDAGGDLRGAEARQADAAEVLRSPELANTLAARGSTHGDFTCNGEIMQRLKLDMRNHPGWEKLAPFQREALEMIQHKVGRILCGNPNFADHWHDIAGYAKLAEERCA